MDRVNVFSYEPDGTSRWVGWFDHDTVTEIIPEDTTWDGHDHVSVHAPTFDWVEGRRRKYHHERLILTRKGDWVLHHWSNWAGDEPRYSYLTAEQAHTWLSINGSDEQIARYFGQPEEGRGPGRPPVDDGGPGALPVTELGATLLARINAEAARNNATRAATVRALFTEALDARDKARSNP
ncbi:hypothetical protein AB0F93_00530 [Micromonospora tulbaghiae]|uniref:hypothetical protein n=1 Tax=Micromonospora tulbaghiae TaxID=479978 RepID=UPI003328A20D